jgi:hypothetical protein
VSENGDSPLHEAVMRGHEGVATGSSLSRRRPARGERQGQDASRLRSQLASRTPALAR